MTQDDILRMAREAGMTTMAHDSRIARFAALVAAAEREKVAHWMRNLGYATGHGDTIEDLLDHLGTQIAEGLEVEVQMLDAAYQSACKIINEQDRKLAELDICDQHASVEGIAQRCAEQIRGRSKT